METLWHLKNMEVAVADLSSRAPARGMCAQVLAHDQHCGLAIRFSFGILGSDRNGAPPNPDAQVVGFMQARFNHRPTWAAHHSGFSPNRRRGLPFVCDFPLVFPQPQRRHPEQKETHLGVRFVEGALGLPWSTRKPTGNEPYSGGGGGANFDTYPFALVQMPLTRLACSCEAGNDDLFI